MSRNEHAYALLIAVGDYQIFDPTGGHDLRGTTADALGWWALTRQLGVPAENVRICAAPAIERGQLGKDGAGVTLGGATHDEITEALGWLAGKLDGEDGTKGLLTYSGHGGRVKGQQVLCPSDVQRAGVGLEGALSVSEVAALVDARAERTRLTVFVDTCHTGRSMPVAGGTARVLFDSDDADGAPGDEAPGGKAPDDAAEPFGALGDLVLASSRPGTASFEIPLAVGVRGAFSWAAQSILARWGTPEASGGVTFGLSYGDICNRATALLGTLGVEQRAAFHGRPAMARLRAFSGFGDRAVGDSEAEVLGRMEIWPDDSGGRVVQFDLNTSASGGTSTSIGTLYLTDANPPSGKGWTAECMYWKWNSGSFPTSTFYALPVAASTTISAPSGGYVYEQVAMTPSYSISATTVPGQHYKISEVRHLGYMRPTSTEQTVYGSNMGASSLAAGFSALTFNYTSGSVADAIYETAVDPIK